MVRLWGKSRIPGQTPFKPYVFIGIAYLVWGCLGGAVAVQLSGDGFSFPAKAGWWGFIAGSLGAFGALTLTYAMYQAKDASLVMPVVFGGATSVAAITGLVIQAQHGKMHVNPFQIIGFILVVAGVVLIQKYSSHGPPPVTMPAPTSQADDHGGGSEPDGHSHSADEKH